MLLALLGGGIEILKGEGLPCLIFSFLLTTEAFAVLRLDRIVPIAESYVMDAEAVLEVGDSHNYGRNTKSTLVGSSSKHNPTQKKIVDKIVQNVNDPYSQLIEIENGESEMG
ncbi:hypothetical protein OROHE_006947 [Orobanche hederae]